MSNTGVVINVITSYSIHYTKLYEILEPLVFLVKPPDLALKLVIGLLQGTDVGAEQINLQNQL